MNVRTAKGPVLKTGKAKALRVRIPVHPPFEFNIVEKWQRGRMRSPAKGVSELKLGSRVQIPPSPPFFFSKFINNASVAQLDRASDYGSEGYGFNSCQVRHFYIKTLILN